MAHFAGSFWTQDYAGGLGVLFGKLQQGVSENAQILTIARMRADAEELYGQHIGDIGPATDRIQDGFQKDDGASVRKAYEGVRVEMEEASRKHYKIASNIRELVVYPFGRWCDQHAARVQNSHDDLQARVKAFDKQSEWVKKLRSSYFNKCRLVEDLEEEAKLAFKEPQKADHTPTASPQSSVATPTVKVQEPDESEPEPVELGDAIYQPEQIKKILGHMLDNIKLGEQRVPILGTYQNVSTGSDIVDYIQRHMNAKTVSYAERIGQDMISNGFLRLIGNVGSEFANSSRMKYQWRPKVFGITGYPEKKGGSGSMGGLARSNTVMSGDGFDSPIVGSMQEYLANWNPLNNAHPNETPSQKLRREARESDERYKAGVRKLDLLRCTLEEAMIEHLKFMERCELDRLKAIKSVILDFSGAISNVIPSLQSTVDKMMLFQETVQPLGDLRYLLENYRTGAFIPKVPTYENYYNSIDAQTFGVDIEARARADRKRVPLVVTSMLMHLDSHYPYLDGDEGRRAIWLVDVPLAATHRLRNEINNGKPITPEVINQYEIPIVAATLKLYLLELPDSLVSSNLYEIIKAVYSNPQTTGSSTTTDTTTSQSDNDSNRISVLQSTLGQLRLVNIATLDAITTHFHRLIDLTSADEAYTASLCQNLAPCILRPKSETALSFEEKYNYRFLRDLLQYKDAIFNELKRASSLSNRQRQVSGPSPSGATGGQSDARPRTLSATDESEKNRRLAMEERNRAIANRSRASSPAPGSGAGGLREGGRGSEPNGRVQSRNRRDSSKGPTETRFPVNATPRANPNAAAAGAGAGGAGVYTPTHLNRQSLEVPDSNLSSSPPSTSTTSAQRELPPIGAQQTTSTSTSGMNGYQYTDNHSHGTATDTPASSTFDRDSNSASQTTSTSQTTANHTFTPSTASISSAAATTATTDVEKRNSLGRQRGLASGGGGGGGGGGLARKQGMNASVSGLQRQVPKRPESLVSGDGGNGEGQTVAGEERERERRGVELRDRPMDD